MNKKGGVTETILDILVILSLIFAIYIIYKNFDASCIFSNLKSFSNWSMSNCIKP